MDRPIENSTLAIALSASVPLAIANLQQMDEEGFSTEFSKIAEYSQMLAEHCDDLLFRSKKKGETAKMFNMTTKAIALLSFVNGGITLFGQHWESTLGEQKE